MNRVAINGLGRIGRATLRLVIGHDELELVAVNDLASAEELAYLLRYDSVYGRSPSQVSTLGNRLVVDGQEIAVLNQREPARLPWAEMGVDLVLVPYADAARETADRLMPSLRRDPPSESRP